MIAVIDYGAGNVASVANALTELKQDFRITNIENEILKSEKIIFPGNSMILQKDNYEFNNAVLNFFITGITKMQMKNNCLVVNVSFDDFNRPSE